jgi:adenylate cyclase
MASISELGRAWLEDSTGQRVPIRGTCSLGRSASNQVALSDETVSRRHAMIQAQGEDEFWVVDFGSRNGTYLNGRRVIHPTRLGHGDRLRLGAVEFLFQQADAAQTAPSTATASDRTVVALRSSQCWLLVADIMDSSRLVQELPLDELPLITGQWVAECKLTIEGCGGRINQFMGDGFFAFWHDRERIEIDVQRALHTLRRLQDQARPRFRFAVHLGQVVIGGVSLGEEERISGREVHFIFRMEKLAGTLGEVRLLSEAAWRRLNPLLETRDLGTHSLTGFDGQFCFYGA